MSKLDLLSKSKGIDLEEVKVLLYNSGVKCKYIVAVHPTLEGFLKSKNNPLYITTPKPNPEIFSLDRKLANLCTQEVLSRPIQIKSLRLHNNSLKLPSITVHYKDISFSLTTKEAILLINCIKATKRFFLSL